MSTNPILPGFYPDPSICRVGEDFYLVNSSFEYFPGVPLWHSRDLTHWRQMGHVLERESQLPLPAGLKASDGIYAPTIRHHDGRFYMVTTHMPALGNFLVHASDPRGPWSEPVLLAQRGIDPSLFFDRDGRCYLTSNGTGWASVRGAYQCEINPLTGEQLTPTRFIWAGTGGAYPEGPHLFRRGDWYYLMLAEGGTMEAHMVTIARAREPYGPFESCPHNPILTHRSLMSPVHATGHADFVEDQNGRWWAVFLGVRYSEHGFHPLGRETYLAPVEWTESGWPVVNGGRPLPANLELPETGLTPAPWPESAARDEFSSPTPGHDWVFARNPPPGAWESGCVCGGLRLRCLAASPDDVASFAGLLRRQRHFAFRARAELRFNSGRSGDEAGLVVMLDNRHRYEVFVYRDPEGHRRVGTRRRIGSLAAEGATTDAPGGPVTLFIAGDRARYRMGMIGPDGVERALAEGEVRYLCSEVAGGYTGVVLGPYATARGETGSSGHALFTWFEYQPLSP